MNMLMNMRYVYEIQISDYSNLESTSNKWKKITVLFQRILIIQVVFLINN